MATLLKLTVDCFYSYKSRIIAFWPKTLLSIFSPTLDGRRRRCAFKTYRMNWFPRKIIRTRSRPEEGLWVYFGKRKSDTFRFHRNSIKIWHTITGTWWINIGPSSRRKFRFVFLKNFPCTLFAQGSAPSLLTNPESLRAKSAPTDPAIVERPLRGVHYNRDKPLTR